MYNTEQKKLIIDFFSNNKEKSFTANELIYYFDGKINKATIYRRLISLENDGIISKSFNELNGVYEYRYQEDCKNHMHLICKKCRKLEHLKCNDVNNFIGHILKSHHFNIDLSTTLYGLCKECEI